MPRKTKEINEEKNIKKQSKLNEKINTFLQNVLEPDSKTNSKKTESSTTKTKTASKTDKSSKKGIPSKSDTKTKRATTTKTSLNDKKENTAKSRNTKKSTTSKEKETKVTKKTSTKKVATSKTTSTNKVASPSVVEYYDLPYKYNQTVVKVLYQNPTTLFVYWEISDSDIENYKNTYGDNFFETTRPVLVVYNDTMNYHFDININDFANSWYFNINDSKCNYRVELIRRPIVYNEKIKTDYIYITSSNKIETPNDRILFSTNEPYIVYFRNTKNNTQRKVNLPKLLANLNLSNKDFGFPIVRNVYDLYKNIYHIEDVGEFSVSLNNPSSGNPSSHSLSSRFI